MSIFEMLLANAMGESGGGGGGGSNDFSTAEVTFVALGEDPDGGGGWTNIVCIVDDNINSLLSDFDSCPNPVTVVLYKGHAYGVASGMNMAVSGNINWNSETEEVDITGDCTISYTQASFS